MVQTTTMGIYDPEMLAETAKVCESEKISEEVISKQVAQLQRDWCLKQAAAGISLFPVNDIFLTDPVFEMARALGLHNLSSWDYFSLDIKKAKWFSGDHLFYVPEIGGGMDISFDSSALSPIPESLIDGSFEVVVSLIGPLTMLGWCIDEASGNPFIDNWQKFLPRYLELLLAYESRGADWIQFHEPILDRALPADIIDLGRVIYDAVSEKTEMKSLLVFNSGHSADNIKKIMKFPVHAVHVDMIHNADNFSVFLDNDFGKIFSLGVVSADFSNLTNLSQQLKYVERSVNQIGLRRTMVSMNRPFYRAPVDGINAETLDEKLNYLAVISKAMKRGRASVQSEIEANSKKLTDKQA